MTTLDDLYSEARFLTAIARRNTAWARWQSVVARWEFAGRPTGELLGIVNDAQYEYEHASRDLIKARVFFREGVQRAKAA